MSRYKLQLKSWNYGQFSMSITRYWVSPIIWAVAYHLIVGCRQLISDHLHEGILFLLSCLSFELYSFYCVHNSTTSTVQSILFVIYSQLQQEKNATWRWQWSLHLKKMNFGSSAFIFLVWFSKKMNYCLVISVKSKMDRCKAMHKSPPFSTQPDIFGDFSIINLPPIIYH